jgi:dolichol kinase
MNFKHEVYRKSFHILLLIFPITYCFLGKWPSLIIFASLTTLVVSLDYFRRKNPKINNLFVKAFGLILRDSEKTGEKFCGASYVGIAACIVFLLFKKEFAVTAFAILAISDALASLIGTRYPSRPFFEKSINGSLAFGLSAFIILIVSGLFFHQTAWYYFFGTFAVFCVTMFEARPSFVEIDDNFIIPVGFATIITFFDLVLNYNY